MLRIENVNKSYVKGKKALDNVSLHIKPKDLFAFIGRNGAGKTTLIKAICGILDFESGEIYIDENSIKSEPVICKTLMAYVPDNPDIYNYMTGTQYLNFISDIYKISVADRTERILKYATLFELDKNLGQKIGQYSHGMKQKLVLISAFIRNPKLLILDEPFVGLDPKASHILKELMKKFCEDGGAIFFSTHVLEVAEKLCNKVAIIKDGKVIKSGTMKDIKGDDSLEEIFLESENA